MSVLEAIAEELRIRTKYYIETEYSFVISSNYISVYDNYHGVLLHLTNQNVFIIDPVYPVVNKSINGIDLNDPTIDVVEEIIKIIDKFFTNEYSGNDS